MAAAVQLFHVRREGVFTFPHFAFVRRTVFIPRKGKPLILICPLLQSVSSGGTHEEEGGTDADGSLLIR